MKKYTVHLQPYHIYIGGFVAAGVLLVIARKPIESFFKSRWKKERRDKWTAILSENNKQVENYFDEINK